MFFQEEKSEAIQAMKVSIRAAFMDTAAKEGLTGASAERAADEYAEIWDSILNQASQQGLSTSELREFRDRLAKKFGPS